MDRASGNPASERFTLQPDGFYHSKGQRGQNVLIRNATVLLSDLYVDQWNSGSCMGSGVGHSKLFGNPAAAAPGDYIPGDFVLATTPDSMFFQHFLDRVALVMAQVRRPIRYGDGQGTVAISTLSASLPGP